MLARMARGGLGFLRYWHDRQLVLDVALVFIDDPRSKVPHAECFRLVEDDGTSRGMHPEEARGRRSEVTA
jgi:hypothetical protein